MQFLLLFLIHDLLLQQIKFLKMKRVAIPIKNNELSEYFGGCNYYEVFEIEGKNIRQQKYELPQITSINELPSWLRSQGVTDVIAYKVDKQIISAFAANKVNLFLGIKQNTTQNLITDYLNGDLESDKKIIEELIH